MTATLTPSERIRTIVEEECRRHQVPVVYAMRSDHRSQAAIRARHAAIKRIGAALPLTIASIARAVRMHPSTVHAIIGKGCGAIGRRKYRSRQEQELDALRKRVAENFPDHTPLPLPDTAALEFAARDCSLRSRIPHRTQFRNVGQGALQAGPERTDHSAHGAST